MVTACVVLLYLSYSIPVVCLLLREAGRKKDKAGQDAGCIYRFEEELKRKVNVDGFRSTDDDDADRAQEASEPETKEVA